MEKYVDRGGNRVNYPTGPIIWGEPGPTDSTRSHQLIHQGTDLFLQTFIAAKKCQHSLPDHHPILLAKLHCPD